MLTAKKIHRFYVSKIDNTFSNNTDIYHRVVHVLRMRVGERIIIFDAIETECLCNISHIDKKSFTLEVIENKIIQIDTKLIKTIILSQIKNDSLHYAIEKAVELGVNQFCVVNSTNSFSQKLKIEKLQKLIIEATEQSGRFDMMTLDIGQNIKDMFDGEDNGIKNKYTEMYGTTIGQGQSVSDYLKRQSLKDITHVRMFIGPEGGYSDKDIELFEKHNVTPVSLCENVLRAETAVIVSSYVLNTIK